MTTLTASESEWAQALVASIQNVAEMRGVPMTPESCDRLLDAVRTEWASATRYDPTAYFDPDIDPGHFDPEAADREAEREQWERMGGADRG